MNSKGYWKVKSVSISILLISAVLAQSCTSLKTAYNWADSYLSWKIDHYFNVNDEQETFIDKRLDATLQFYKLQEVPKYKAFLSEIILRTERQLTVDDLAWLRASLDQFNANIAHLLIDDVTSFLFEVNEAQIAHLEKALLADNETWWEEHQQEAKKSKKAKLDDLYEKLEEWIGELSSEQKQELADMYEGYDAHMIRYNRRLQSQQSFVELLNRKYPKEELRTALLDWYLNSEQSYSPEYKEHLQIRNARTDTLILTLDRMATEKQRQHFFSKVNDYLKQLDEILTS